MAKVEQAPVFEVRDANYVARIRQRMQAPIVRDFFRVEEVLIAPGEVHLGIDVRPELGHAPGWFQGSVTTAIAEFAAGLAGLTLLAANYDLMTLDQTISFVGPARGERLVAKGRVVKPGKGITVCQCEVYAVEGGRERLCGIMMQTNHVSPLE